VFSRSFRFLSRQRHLRPKSQNAPNVLTIAKRYWHSSSSPSIKRRDQVGVRFTRLAAIKKRQNWCAIGAQGTGKPNRSYLFTKRNCGGTPGVVISPFPCSCKNFERWRLSHRSRGGSTRRAIWRFFNGTERAWRPQRRTLPPCRVRQTGVPGER